MSDLNDVVRVVIYDGSTAITTASFQYPMILNAFTNFAERARVYPSLEALAVDFSSISRTYAMASKLFGQSGVLGAPPPAVIVGRRQVDSVNADVIVANNSVYTVTINELPYSYTSDNTATAIEIVAGLKTAVGSPAGINFVDHLDGTFTVGPTTPGDEWSLRASSNIEMAMGVSTESIVDALAAVEVENDTWYFVASETKDKAEQEALSDAIAAREKIYGLSSSDPVGPTTGITDIGYKLNAKSAARTFGVWLPTAGADYPECAWAGSQLAVTPGANDWDYKRANGVTVSKLSPTQILNLKNKSWNYYIPKGGVNIFMDGNMFDKKPIDQMKVA